MKKVFVSAVIIVLFASELVFGQAFNRPESLIYDAAHERYLISNYGNGSNGSILAFDPIAGVYSHFNEDHSVGPKGLAIFNNTLYVSEDGFINGFNLDTKQRVFNRAVGSNWINDLTVDELGNLYTGETNTGKIYKINVSNGHTEEWISGGLDDLNGLWVDSENNRLLVVFYAADSPVLAIDLTTKEITTLVVDTGYSNCDGITADNCGNYYISSQGSGLVFKYENNFTDPSVVVVEDLTTPADIHYNQALDVLCIPEIDNNQIVYVDFFQTCQQPLLLKPANLAGSVSLENLSFSWLPVLKAEYYRFELALDLEFSQFVTVDGTAIPTYIFESLEPLTTYYWRVSAYFQNQHTEYSEIWSFESEGGSWVGSHERKDEYLIFPNPSIESVNLYWGDEIPKELKLFTTIGQQIFEFTEFVNTKYSGQTIPLGGLSSGSYYSVVTMTSGNVKIQQLVVQ